MDKPQQPFVTSVRVDTRGSHEWVTVWIQGRNVGTLTVGHGDGERLKLLLMPLVQVPLVQVTDIPVQLDPFGEQRRLDDMAGCTAKGWNRHG
jgi:hypothetical protein